MKSAAGICLGASSISIVRAIADEQNHIKVSEVLTLPHYGDPQNALRRSLSKVAQRGDSIVVTGRKLRNLIESVSISEPEATELALAELYGDKKFSAVASLGGETFIVYNLDSQGKISSVTAKNQCASGTGEFFMQQIKRMDLSLEEALNAAEGETPYRVSGRCSVFCKSDCTHALNKGVAKGQVASGLASMIADKIEELLEKTQKRNILLIGGVTRNRIVMDNLQLRYKNLIIPEQAAYFEAFGAAVYAVKNGGTTYDNPETLISERKSSFIFHKPLSEYGHLVEFKSETYRKPAPGERTILGLDIGSTTTKAAIVALSDDAVLASTYLYTNGDPIHAARECYRKLYEEVGDTVGIIALGTTGSGRHIAGLHALTDEVINEIVAHATAAVHYDPEVDTIFEIGGQDAKYTYIVNKTPADYAMNEACSAGTGSFIEESAYESLGIKVTDIEPIAMSGSTPPNFSDQCAAFISSDIKTALQEGLAKEDVVAGLVYSICMNYVNRVKGARPVGKKIFMQGGVCYNKAVPIAMAGLTGMNIIVPPEPGLMGALGVALSVKEKIALGLTTATSYSLKELSERQVNYKKSFVCAGGAEKCDLKCSINMIELDGKNYPFGGACNKYYSYRNKPDFNVGTLDYVKVRNELLFGKYSPKKDLPADAKVIGINKSFHTHTAFPLFYNFFTELGFKVILSERIHDSGLERELTSFCYPAQLSMGLFADLIEKKPDYYFLPTILEMYVEDAEYHRLDFNCTCVFVSGETFFIKQAYKDLLDMKKVLDPKFNFAYGFGSQYAAFSDLAKRMGISDEAAISEAHTRAVAMQNRFQEELYEIGAQALKKLEKNPNQFAVVLIGRTYNSFADEANKNIPRKFASHGVTLLPYDMFDFRSKTIEDNMYWEGGKKILKVAKVVKEHPQLFAAYISNFSCGPDSMILTTFRGIMGRKPSLTLELDSHSADAGINTRIEAAIDIIKNYRKINSGAKEKSAPEFKPATIEVGAEKSYFIKSNGERIPLNDPSVEILIPSMGDLAAVIFAAALRSLGFNSKPIRQADGETLKYGRANASGKECLPLLLLVGGLVDYLENERAEGKNVVLFNVQGAGNCRLGQYPVFIRDMIRKKKLENVTQMVLMNEDGFAGFGGKFAMRGIQAIMISDVMDDVRSAVLAHSADPDTAIDVFDREYARVVRAMESDPERIYDALERFSENLRRDIPPAKPIGEAKYIALCGEIYVRRDGFSHKWLNKYFAKRGFILKDAYISEWILYVDYLLKIDLLEPEKSLRKKLERNIRNFFMRQAEKKIKRILEKSGYYKFVKTDVEAIMNHSKHILPLDYKGEPGITLGTALGESLEKYCGIINLGPFGCMPTRLTEAITQPEMTVAGKIAAKKTINPHYSLNGVFAPETTIPFLTIETDGNVFPQVIEAKLETFTLQAERTAELMRLHKEAERD